MAETKRDPVAEWATDFDHTHPDYAAAATEIWDDLRAGCPVAHSERFGGTWLPTRHEDIAAIAADTEHFTSQGVIVTEWRPDVPAPVGYAPPITSDPPFHALARRVLLPYFSPKAMVRWENTTRAMCRELLDTALADGATAFDAAADYAQHIPVRVIADMLGLPRDDGDKFRGFIHRIIEVPGQVEVEQEDTLDHYLKQIVADRKAKPGDDLISYLLSADLDGVPLDEGHVEGTIGLLIIAGIDTTWSAIGASLWHLAQHPEHLQRLRDDPEVIPFAVEEFLRFYAPVTMARLVAEPVQIGDASMQPGDWCLLPFPAANRDPEFFERADEFVIDRAANRHSAFGLGIHRCIGSNLARLELRIALEEFVARIPSFELADPSAVRWSTGQVRGPRLLPVRLT
ncbi:MAG: cytochrome P450 [Acidimicrobiales bacterium]|nr:cytochrome P450 [Acidimicrobiales bacterium]